MKPDWDKLSAEYKDSKTAVIADVDCTADGKSLCEANGVRGYPTIKTGPADDLQDYKGGRDLASLKKHAETLGPSCGPATLDLCDDAKKAKLQEFMKLDAAERDSMIKELEESSKKIEEDFKTFVDGLQKSYKEASDKKEADVAAVSESGLGMLKSVAAHAKKAKSEL